MKINEIYNELLDEKCYHTVHPTGLNTYVMPKKGYSGAYAVFGTNYGSIDTKILNKKIKKRRRILKKQNTN